jgi:quercetin dioxygenase-like cupin family protein
MSIWYEEKNELHHEGELLAKTPYSPERVLLSKGLEIMSNAGDDTRLVTISSEEGMSGFLVATDHLQAQFLIMNPDLYSEEHAHDYGYIIYTMEGRWVLCSQGKRCLMAPGSVCGISAGVSTGMEAPFEEPVRLLFLLTGGVDVQRRYEEYMRINCEGRVSVHRDGMRRISDLPASHPARVFARSLGLPDPR